MRHVLRLYRDAVEALMRLCCVTRCTRDTRCILPLLLLCLCQPSFSSSAARDSFFCTMSKIKLVFFRTFFLIFFSLYVQAASKPTAARDIAEHTMSILNEALAVPLRTPRTARDASRVAGVV